MIVSWGELIVVQHATALQDAFRAWVNSLVELTDGEVVAIDGKALRRSFRDAGNKAFVHMVSAWAVNNRVVLGQVKTDAKSNEITAIPKLLELLNIKKTIVTIDAMGCQKAIAKKIIEKKADYVLAIKDNQPTLFDDVKAVFADVSKDNVDKTTFGFAETSGKGHGRKEVRRCYTCDDLSSISVTKAWPGLSSVVMVEALRTVGEKTSTERRFYISSKKKLPAKKALTVVRSHWGIENELHWVLDVAFREDDCRVRAGNAAENFAVMRHFTMNLLKKVKSSVGIKGRRLQAGWNHEFLLKVLAG